MVFKGLPQHLKTEFMALKSWMINRWVFKKVLTVKRKMKYLILLRWDLVHSRNLILKKSRRFKSLIVSTVSSSWLTWNLLFMLSLIYLPKYLSTGFFFCLLFLDSVEDNNLPCFECKGIPPLNKINNGHKKS